MGQLAKFMTLKSVLCISVCSIKICPREHKKTRFDLTCGALTIFLFCYLITSASCSQIGCEQDQGGVDAFSLSPEGLCSVDVTQLSSRDSQQDDLESIDKIKVVHQEEAGNRESLDTENLEVKSSRGFGDGKASETTNDQHNVCGVALFQGRRPSQEDRAICFSQLCLPVSGIENITVGLYAVFDGHGGQEASTFAAEVFRQHFIEHFTQIIDSSEVASTRSSKTSRQDGTWISQESWFHDSPFQNEDSSPGALEASIMLDHEDRGTWLHSETSHDARRYKGDRTVKPSDVSSLKDNQDGLYKTPVEKSAEGEREQGGVLPEDRRRQLSRKVLEDGITIRQILEDALSRAVFSIDTKFSVEARQLGLFGGTTACIALQVEEDLLVANLGDSKALFCEPSGEVSCGPKPSRRRRKKLEGSKGDCKTRLRARELTRDHRPDRHDERQRIEGAGGFVTIGDVPRVNGKLAVSRSIGDVHLKRYGLIADPEFTGWVKIPKGQSFLAIASDGVFEKLTSQSVCDVLHAINVKEYVFSVLGLENSRANAPIAMPPSAEGFYDQGGLVFRNGTTMLNRKDCSQFVGEDICATLDKDIGNFSSAVIKSPEMDEGEQKGAESTEEKAFMEAPTLVQSMAQAVGEAAVELGTMDNVATIVLSLRPLPPLLPDPTLLFDETTEESLPLTDDPQTDVELSDENTVHGLRDEANVVKPVIEAGSVSSNGSSTSRAWSKSHNRNKSSVVMVQNLETSYCYELIETLPRHAIVPFTNIVEGETLRPEDEAVNREGLLTTDVYHKDGKSAVDRHSDIGLTGGGSVEIYREQLVCTPQQTLDKEMKELCRRTDRLSHFLALIGSVPLDSQTLLPDTDISSDRPVFVPSSTRYHRYMLKKNFARGAFGEVWLAVRRARSVPDGSDTNDFYNSSCYPEYEASETTEQNSSSKHDRTTYVLKRILVERGNHVYLSGLREKYFGEIFLNASIARARASKYSSSFTCASSNPFSSSRFGFCPWRLIHSRNIMRQNSGSRRTENFRCSDRSNIGPSIPEEGLEHIARYVESLEVIGPRELWLVFKNEGKSLSSLLYSSEGAEVEPDMEGADGFFTVVQPSSWWHWLKSTPAGRKEMRSILRQLLLAVKACHSRNITHRDIKPENMIVSWKGAPSASTSKADHPSKLKMRLIDFGSALDPFTVKHLYGPSGPSRLEQTNEYAPPEALLGNHWLHFHSQQAHVYDIWSVGVVMLELVLGTPHVFQISSRTRALLDRRLQGWDQSAKETAYMLRAFMEMCILRPGISVQHKFHHPRDNLDNSEEQRLASWECTEQAFLEQMKQKDILGIGMPDKWALRLVRRLLQWYPEDRISADDALKHPYFHPKLQTD